MTFDQCANTVDNKDITKVSDLSIIEAMLLVREIKHFKNTASITPIPDRGRLMIYHREMNFCPQYGRVASNNMEDCPGRKIILFGS